MASTGTSVTLKQADIDLLVAVCKQLGKVDTKQLAEDLGVNTSAAGMRWKRFRDRTFGDKKEAETEGGFQCFNSRSYTLLGTQRLGLVLRPSSSAPQAIYSGSTMS
jgi:hypothetical protein